MSVDFFRDVEHRNIVRNSMIEKLGLVGNGYELRIFIYYLQIATISLGNYDFYDQLLLLEYDANHNGFLSQDDVDYCLRNFL